jgi:hypothetical protein
VHNILTTEGELCIWCYRHQKPFSYVRFAARRPAAQGKGFSFLYPAFTSQRVRKTAPTLTRPIRSAQGKLCWATFGPFGAPQGRLFGAGFS